MGWYLRRSVSVGPFRFNLSNSGVGMSVGVPGFRVGSGPRGNYVQLGMGGVYYRQTIPRVEPAVPSTPLLVPAGTHGPMEAIESANAAEIRDSSSEALLEEIREKQRRTPMMPFAATLAGSAVFYAIVARWAAWAIVITALLAIALLIWTSYRDRIRKTVVIMYDLDASIEQSYRRFTEWADAIAASRKVWHIAATGRVHDRKYHAGASALLQRHVTAMRTAQPSFLATNVPVPSLAVGRQTLYFFPDRMLITDGSSTGAIAYGSLEIKISRTRFIEEQGVPSDAQVVDHTWKYVNRNGTPDRRFNHNPRLPVCAYDEMHFLTASGLNEIVQISRQDVAEGFALALQSLSAAISATGRTLSSTPATSSF